VEPRGFEPLTSAVQMLAHHFADVRGRSETRLSKPLTVQASSPMVAVVLVGNCHVTVKSSMADLDPDGKVAPPSPMTLLLLWQAKDCSYAFYLEPCRPCTSDAEVFRAVSREEAATSGNLSQNSVTLGGHGPSRLACRPCPTQRCRRLRP
jgi:hypothetical protein